MDLRFADDILLFANSGPDVAQILDKFVKAVGKVGLRPNIGKTVIVTNEAQPPNTFVTKDGLILKVFGAESGAKMARIHIDRLWKYDAAHGSRLPGGTRYENYALKPLNIAGQSTFNILRLKYFNACASAVICFRSGHRTLFKKQLNAVDVLFRRLCQSIVTNTDWSLEWHEILHHWNDRARNFAQTAGLKPWS